MKKLIFEAFGNPLEVLNAVSEELPEIGDEEILVKVKFAPINPYELAIIEGKNFDLPMLPAVAGHEGMGTVVRAGKRIKRFKEGQRVILGPVTLPGTWREYVKGEEDQFFPIPDSVSDLSAAVLMNAINSYLVLSESLKVLPGQWILCTAATTDIGQLLLQYSRVFNFKLINLIRNKKGKDKMQALGAEFLIDVSSQDVLAEINRLTDGQGVNGIIDLSGGSLGTLVANSLVHEGKMVLFSKMSGEDLDVDPMLFISKTLSLTGFTGWHWAFGRSYESKSMTINAVFELLKSKKLILNPGNIYPLTQFKRAIAESMQSGKGGKVLLSMEE